MAGLIPFNRKGGALARAGAGYDDFQNMLDDFFADNWLHQNRSLLRDTFKIDIEEKEKEYRVEAELPGVKKEEIGLNIEDDSLCISVSRAEETNSDGKNYIHRERRASSMSRRVRLADANLEGIKAKLDEGILVVTIPKAEKTASSRKIDIE